MDLGMGVHPPSPGRGGGLFFMMKQKNIRDKMIYSTLSNNMMIKNCKQQLQFKYSSQGRFGSSQAGLWAGSAHD
jgi:hypothetical protein